MSKRFVGFSLVLFSIVLAFFNNSNITGATISSDIIKSLNMIIVIFFIIGLIMTQNKKESSQKSSYLESIVNVYDDGLGKKLHNREDHHFMTDPKLSFGNKGIISLKDFRKEIGSYKTQGEDGESLIKVIRDEYKSDLMKIASSDDSVKSRIAYEFLNILDIDYNQEDGYGLNRDERRELQIAFRQSGGSPIRADKNVVKKYNLKWETAGKHIRLWQAGYEDNVVFCPSTPSDWRGGRNKANDVIKMVGENRKKRQA